MEASAIWGRPRMSLSIFWPAPNSMSGRFCRCAPPDTATRPMPALRLSRAIPRLSAWSFFRLGLDRWRTHCRLAGSSGAVDFEQVEAAEISAALRGRGKFSRSRSGRPHLPSNGQHLKSFAARRLRGSTITRSTPCCAANSKPARGPSGPSRCAAAIRRRWPRPPPTRARA